MCFYSFMSGLSGPFVHHLVESIEINSKRLPRYAKLTRYRSVPHSLKLILSEQASIPFAFTVDRLAKPYQKAGIPIGDLEFMSMKLVRPFEDQFPFEPEPLTDFVPVDGKELARKLMRAFRSEGFDGVSRVGTAELEKIHQPRAYHCMTRHLLESIIRIANLAPHHQARAKEIGFESKLASCERISKMMYWGHILSFAAGAAMDKAAAPIQARGIPLIWQDVPDIPPMSDFYKTVD